MKKIQIILSSLLIIATMACSKDDPQVIPIEGMDPPTETPPAETPVNSPPAAFNLLNVPNAEDSVELMPTFSWEASIDPDGDSITYDLYIDNTEIPTTLISADLTETNFTLSTRLNLITEYYWKVIAKDSKGAKTESQVYGFMTRYPNIPNTPLSTNTIFSKREYHTAVPFLDKLWVFGGNDGEILGDVWSTDDGINWIENPIEREFPPRYFHTTTVFKDKVFIIGGISNNIDFNGIRYSDDAALWRSAGENVDFSKRYRHASVVFNNRLWVIGGISGSDYANDVWSSADGTEWTQETAAANFSPRYGHRIEVFNDKLWLMGGFDGSSKNDIWSSSDGANWELVTDNANFSPRYEHATVIFDDKIWVIAGSNDFGDLKDIWVTDDGSLWKQADFGGGFSERSGHTAAVFNDKLYIMAGASGTGSNSKKNDVWIID